MPYPSRITIADNASTDNTLAVAQALAEELPDVEVIHLDEKGRGGALYTAWMASEADVVAYMDVDLSTDLSALMPLVAPLISGHSDVAIGSRLAASSRVVRGPKREFVSRSYNLILRGVLGARFSDAQCGFKAVRADVARQLLPHVADTGWFFDTELLVIAERAGTAHPRGAGRLGRRSRTRASTSCAPRSTTSRAAGGWAVRWRPARCRSASCSAASAASRWCRACRAAWSVRWSGSASSASRAPLLLPCCICCFTLRWAPRPRT